jgi:hypothetical protein
MGILSKEQAKLMAVGLGKQLEKDRINMPDAFEEY